MKLILGSASTNDRQDYHYCLLIFPAMLVVTLLWENVGETGIHLGLSYYKKSSHYILHVCLSSHFVVRIVRGPADQQKAAGSAPPLTSA